MKTGAERLAENPDATIPFNWRIRPNFSDKTQPFFGYSWAGRAGVALGHAARRDGASGRRRANDSGSLSLAANETTARPTSTSTRFARSIRNMASLPQAHSYVLGKCACQPEIVPGSELRFEAVGRGEKADRQPRSACIPKFHNARNSTAT